MRDVFPDETVETQGGEFVGNDAEAARIRDALEGQQVCPFCGDVSDGSQSACAKCTMENSPVARKATKQRIGPWYVLQSRNPAAPGMKWETLLTFVQKGRIKPQSIVRGPTTHQLWRFAAHVKGLSREFGVCYSCGGSIERGANLCAHCNRLQEPPVNPDTLLEGGEAEPRGAIFKELPPSDESDPRDAAGVDPAAQANAELQKKLAERAAELEKVQQERQEEHEAIARQREELETAKEAASREQDQLRAQADTIARDREAVNRDKEALQRDRAALARDRESLRRDRETVVTAPAVAFAASSSMPAAPSPAISPAPPGDDARAVKATPPTEPAASVWDLNDADSKPPAWARSPDDSNFDKPPIPTGARPKARDGFLSPKDLAAAFKLNLAAQPTPAGSGAPGDEWSPRPTPDAPPGAGRKWFVLSLLVVMAAVVVAQPAFRRRLNRLMGQTAAPVKPAAGIQGGHANDSQPPTAPHVQPADRGPAPLIVPSTMPAATQSAEPSARSHDVSPALPAAPTSNPSAVPTTAPIDSPAFIAPTPALPAPAMPAPGAIPSPASAPAIPDATAPSAVAPASAVPSPAAPAPAASGPASPAAVTAAAAIPSQVVAPSASPAPVVSSQVTSPLAAPIVPAPAANVSPALPIAPAAASGAASAPATVPATVDIAAPATLPAAPLATAPTDPFMQAQVLFTEAKEAEDRADIAEAARLYDQILQLPRDTWPPETEKCAKLAHRQLKLIPK